MNATSREAIELIQAAMKLPQAERREIAEQLLDSLSPFEDPEIEEAWANELRRRLEDFKKSGEEGIPWEEVKRQGQEIIRKARQRT